MCVALLPFIQSLFVTFPSGVDFSRCPPGAQTVLRWCVELGSQWASGRALGTAGIDPNHGIQHAQGSAACTMDFPVVRTRCDPCFLGIY